VDVITSDLSKPRNLDQVTTPEFNALYKHVINALVE
jgi:hypothetical protein